MFYFSAFKHPVLLKSVTFTGNLFQFFPLNIITIVTLLPDKLDKSPLQRKRLANNTLNPIYLIRLIGSRLWKVRYEIIIFYHRDISINRL